MIVKFFANKKGGGVSSIDYLLDKRTQQGTARILRGDEKLTRELIKSMNQKHKACVGCLSFEERNIDENAKKEIMQSFENMLLTPEMQGRYNILWVEHTDKGRLELNFVIPKIDLESKKAFNPYFHMADLKRKDLWTDFVNLKHNLSNPKDPAKENTIQGSKKETALFNDYEALDKFLHEKVSQGLLTSRKSIIELLKANSIEITREGKDYISVKLPESKKAKRFKGGIYDEQFTGTRELETILDRATANARAFNQRDTTREIERVRQELDKLIQSKARYYHEKNRKQAIQKRQHTPSIQMEQHSNELSSRNTNNDDFKRDCMVSVDKTLSSLQRENNNDRKRKEVYTDERGGTHQTEQQIVLSNPIGQGQIYDDTRSRAYSRSREITRRVRSNIDTAREDTERQERAIKRARELDEQISRLRDFIQSQFREFADTIRKRVKAVIEKRREREQEIQRHRQRGRGFSR